jgi:organic radical activating enzyme
MSKKCWVPYNEVNILVGQGTLNYCCKVSNEWMSLDHDISHGSEIVSNNKLTAFRQGLYIKGMPMACMACRVSELEGSLSWRQQEGIVPPQFDNQTDLMSNSAYFNQINIYFDNHCDSACLYCNEDYSSKWEAEKIRNGETWLEDRSNTRKTNYQSRIQKIHEFLIKAGEEIPKKIPGQLLYEIGVNLTFLGGEPLLSPELRDGKLETFIDDFYTHAPKDYNVTVTIHTNANSNKYVLDRFFQSIENLKNKYPRLNIKIVMSIESIGKALDYIRYGSTWHQVEENVHRYMSNKSIFIVSFNPTFNILSLPNSPEYFKWLVGIKEQYNDRELFVSSNVVFSPMYLNPYNASEYFKPQVLESLEIIKNNKDKFELGSYNNLVNRFEDLHKNMQKRLLPEFVEMIEYVKKNRNMDIADYIPDWEKNV